MGSNPERTIVEYYAEHEGYRCGYCKSPNTNYSHGMWGHCLNVQDYENLLNRGWRRSGSYLYKPTNSVTCCPMYTISCHALEFSLSKSQRKVLRKFHAYLGASEPKGLLLEDYLDFDSLPGFSVKLLKVGSPEFNQNVIRMEHSLYVQYQSKVHNEEEDECDLKQFKRFLCSSPLVSSSDAFGSFHQQYYIHDKLIAVGVVDILPSCLSSVYFFYDPELMTQLSPGTLGALYEIDFVRKMHKTLPNFKYYYMGFYIHSCQKMRYKGNFSPSFLLCPESYTWALLDDKLRGRLDVTPYTRFAEGTTEGSPPKDEDIEQVVVLHKRAVMPYKMYKQVRRRDAGGNGEKSDDAALQQFVNLVGASNAGSIWVFRE